MNDEEIEILSCYPKYPTSKVKYINSKQYNKHTYLIGIPMVPFFITNENNF